MSASIQTPSPAKRVRYQLQARGRVLSALQSMLLSRGLKTVDDFWFDVDLCPIRTLRDAEKAVDFFSESADFEYRFVRVRVDEWSLSLLLTAAEVRVVKSALLVEIAALEFRVREDHRPDVWLPALTAARRVFTALCDKANKDLLDL